MTLGSYMTKLPVPIRKSRSTHLLVDFAKFQTVLDNENDLNDASDQMK